MGSLIDRVMRRVEYDTVGGCWLWTGAVNQNGYSRFSSRNTGPYAGHRLAYELLCEPIPEGMELDHKCRVRCCVNPAHLEPVTREENIARGVAARTHCKRGHAFTPENMLANAPWAPRVCRLCRNENARRRWADFDPEC